MGILPDLLPAEVIERAKRLNTTLITDAMGCSGGMDYTIKPVSPNMRIVATALTVSMRPGDNLFLHKAIYMGKEGYAIVADGKNHKANAYLGELMAGCAKAIGLEGIIIDGLVRDKNALEDLGLPVFAKGFIPNGPLKDGPGELNSTISCGGVSVQPGDLVLGDQDGVAVVPKSKIEEVLEKAEAKLAYEEKRLDTIRDYEEKRKRGIAVDTGILEPLWLKEKKGSLAL